MRSSSGRSRKRIVAWLVTWEWAGNQAKPEHKIAAILNSRWSPNRVREYVEFIYVNSHCSLTERIDYAKNRSLNPYPAEFDRVKGVSWCGQITCGHNPWFFARLVDDLMVTSDSDDEEKVVWKERSTPDFDKIFGKLGNDRDDRT